VVEDLPGREAVLTDTRPTRAARRIVAVIGNDERSGRWRPGEDTRALALVGDCTLDLRQADVAGGERRITAIAVIGDVRVVVPPGVAVQLEGISPLGDKQ
jgi:predicted membrane protein